MAERILADNVSGDLTTDGSFSLTSSQSEVYIKSGTFTSIKFEDSKYGGDWHPITYADDGSEVELTSGTNELELISATNTSRRIRAVITGAVDLTIGVDEGVL